MLGHRLAGCAHRQPLWPTATARVHGLVADALRKLICHVLLLRSKHDLDSVIGHEVARGINPVDGA